MATQADLTATRIQTSSIPDVLEADVTNLDVPEGQQLVFSPETPRLKRFFHRVHLRSFQDLQMLGLIPQQLDEEAVRKAIVSDDHATLELVSRMTIQVGDGECSCHTTSSRSTMSRAQYLRDQYRILRREHNPQLAKILSEHQKKNIDWNSPYSILVRGWVRRLDSLIDLQRPILVATALDININKGAKFIVDKALRSLLARNIQIHETGQMVCRGGSIKIWASTVMRPSRLHKLFDEVPWNKNRVFAEK